MIPYWDIAKGVMPGIAVGLAIYLATKQLEGVANMDPKNPKGPQTPEQIQLESNNRAGRIAERLRKAGFKAHIVQDGFNLIRTFITIEVIPETVTMLEEALPNLAKTLTMACFYDQVPIITADKKAQGYSWKSITPGVGEWCTLEFIRRP